MAVSICLLIQAWEQTSDLREQWVELAAYMAMVREKRCGCHNQTDLYGMLTDGNRFMFLKLDKEGNLTRSEELTWKHDPNVIFGLLGDAMWIGREMKTECGSVYPKLRQSSLDDDLGTFRIGGEGEFEHLLFCYAKENAIAIKDV